MEPKSTPSSVTVDEEGDLVLLVGVKAQTRILVSSKVLTISSKVFKAMLSKSFKEARELAQSVHNNQTYELPLPDDDAHTMIVLCKATHHRSWDIPAETITMPLLRKFASHVHKYDCVEAVRTQAVSSWIASFESDPTQTLGLVVVSYLLDNAEGFTKFTRTMLMSDKVDIVPFRESWDTEHQLPESFFVILEKKRQAAIEFLSEQITNHLDSMVQGPAALVLAHGYFNGWGNSSPLSQHDAQLTQMFITNMRTHILWPHKLSDRSLHATLTVLRCLKNSESPTKEVQSSDCLACGTSMREHLTQIIDDAETFIEGVCLDCFHQKDGLERKCRVQHNG
ncbi:hypothetical protein EG328_006627 [Venturia inaequalis]|uniref:BTB domain-containing protein n=1 Tax=Venturia inaequalis TaxID=5025 RepID=A0A8H3UIA0_VENIN|nr:hypothetical protein EG328_006627 [Venturia inaequalis]